MSLKISKEWSLPAGFHFVQSNLQDFADCERRFYLRYVLNQPWPAPFAEPQAEIERALKRGARFHLLAERHHAGIPFQTLVQSVIDDAILGKWLPVYQEVLAKLGTFDRSWAEIELGSRIHDYPLVAKYDLIAIQNRTLLAIDWKTGELPSRPRLEARMQTIVYRLVLYRHSQTLAARYDFEKIGLRYVSVENGETCEFEVDAKIAQKLEAQLETLIDRLFASTFAKVADERMCRFCLYRSLCERGHTITLQDLAAADLENMWHFESSTGDDTIEF